MARHAIFPYSFPPSCAGRHPDPSRYALCIPTCTPQQPPVGGWARACVVRVRGSRKCDGASGAGRAQCGGMGAPALTAGRGLLRLWAWMMQSPHTPDCGGITTNYNVGLYYTVSSPKVNDVGLHTPPAAGVSRDTELQRHHLGVVVHSRIRYLGIRG